jgi:hypothetical protein
MGPGLGRVRVPAVAMKGVGRSPPLRGLPTVAVVRKRADSRNLNVRSRHHDRAGLAKFAPTFIEVLNDNRV